MKYSEFKEKLTYLINQYEFDNDCSIYNIDISRMVKCESDGAITALSMDFEITIK